MKSVMQFSWSSYKGFFRTGMARGYFQNGQNGQLLTGSGHFVHNFMLFCNKKKVKYSLLANFKPIYAKKHWEKPMG